MLKLLLPKVDKPYFVIIPCDENSINVRKRAYGMRIKLSLINDDVNSKILVVDYGMSDEEKDELLQICKECNGIYYVKNEFLKDFFDGRV